MKLLTVIGFVTGVYVAYKAGKLAGNIETKRKVIKAMAE